LLAAALASYPAALGWRAGTVGGAIGGLGVVLVLAALIGLWEDGLVVGPALLLIAYVTALAVVHHAHDPGAPILAAGLLVLVDLGSWSLELRESRETHAFHHLRMLLPLTFGALAASAAVLAAGSLGSGGGVGLWVLGAVAAAGVFILIRPRRGSRLLGQSTGGSNRTTSALSESE
jgi:hypothetical protein